MTIDLASQGESPLRILHVLRAPLGGLFRHVLDLTREQVARGHAVGLVVDSLTGGDRATEILAALEPVLKLGVLRIPMLRAPRLQDIGAVIRVEAHARKLAVDVIHGHGSKGGLYARLPGYLPRAFAPIRCYTPHGGSFNHVATPLVQGVYMTVERLLAARTDVFLFESVFIAKRFHQRIGDTQALAHIVQNGINPNEFTPIRPKANAVDFIYVGELRSAKGIDTLIEATAALSRRRGQTLKLLLVGSGPDEQALIRQAEAAGIAAQVTFAGAMPAPVAFTLGRILVVPSRAESLPYIVLEAVGAQIPMIATDVGGINEIFGPYRERLIACDDPALLAQAMERMLDLDPVLVRQQAEDLATFASTRFSVANMADSVVAGYLDAFARRALLADDAKRSSALPS